MTPFSQKSNSSSFLLFSIYIMFIILGFVRSTYDETPYTYRYAIYIGEIMAKMNGFGWYNESAARRDTYEPDVFDMAEDEFSSEGYEYANGKPMAGICGYEASLMRYLDNQDVRRNVRACAKV